MHPFAEIEVIPLYSKDGMKSSGKSVRIRDEESETGWDEVGIVSPNYLLVPNEKVKAVIGQIAERSKIADWKEKKCFFDGKRFIYCITTESITAEIQPGDFIRFGLIAHNSYDGSRAISVGAYAEHLVCSNGMTCETFFSRFTFRHSQGNINWDDETEKAFLSIMPTSKAKLVVFASMLNKLSRKPMQLADLKLLRKTYLNELSSAVWGKVIDRYLLDEKHSAFGLLDACTRIFWHNERQNYSDYRNDSYATDALISYARHLN